MRFKLFFLLMVVVLSSSLPLAYAARPGTSVTKEVQTEVAPPAVNSDALLAAEESIIISLTTKLLEIKRTTIPPASPNPGTQLANAQDKLLRDYFVFADRKQNELINEAKKELAAALRQQLEGASFNPAPVIESLRSDYLQKYSQKYLSELEGFLGDRLLEMGQIQETEGKNPVLGKDTLPLAMVALLGLVIIVGLALALPGLILGRPDRPTIKWLQGAEGILNLCLLTITYALGSVLILSSLQGGIKDLFWYMGFYLVALILFIVARVITLTSTESTPKAGSSTSQYSTEKRTSSEGIEPTIIRQRTDRSREDRSRRDRPPRTEVPPRSDRTGRPDRYPRPDQSSTRPEQTTPRLVQTTPRPDSTTPRPDTTTPKPERTDRSDRHRRDLPRPTVITPSRVEETPPDTHRRESRPPVIHPTEAHRTHKPPTPVVDNTDSEKLAEARIVEALRPPEGFLSDLDRMVLTGEIPRNKTHMAEDAETVTPTITTEEKTTPSEPVSTNPTEAIETKPKKPRAPRKRKPKAETTETPTSTADDNDDGKTEIATEMVGKTDLVNGFASEDTQPASTDDFTQIFSRSSTVPIEGTVSRRPGRKRKPFKQR